MSIVTAATWVPRGFAAQFPRKQAYDEEEYSHLAKVAELQLDDARKDLEEAQDHNQNDSASEHEESSETTQQLRSKEDADDDLKEYDMDKYDSDSQDEESGAAGMFGNIKSLVYHESNADDPYITLQDDNEDEDEEREELQILATDNLVLAARIEDEIAHLEIYVYEDDADNLYVHHDIMLPAIPLAVEWLGLPVGDSTGAKAGKGNIAAVATMDPDIELWDLDIIDSMLPDAVLGRGSTESSKPERRKKKKKKAEKPNDEYHVDAVLALAANRRHKNLLASASADKTVKLWELSASKCAKSYSYHTDKVCSVAWHPQESTILLSGSYDRTVVAADMRAPNATAPRWGVDSDVENVKWDPHNPNSFYVSTEDGMLYYHDVRKAPSTPEASKPVWTLQAHSESISSFDVNPHIPGYLVTGSTDKQVKLWSISNSSDGENGVAGPNMVTSRNLSVGKVFATSFAPDPEVAFRLAVAGSKGSLQIWDTSTNAAVRRNFAHRFGTAANLDQEVKEKMVGLNDDDESSSDDDQDGGVELEANGADDWESMEE